MVWCLLRLSRSRHDGRLFGKDVGENGQKVQNVRSLSKPGQFYHLDLRNIRTHLPMFSPMRQIWMIYPPISGDMLTGPYDHFIRRRDIEYRSLVGVGMRNPYCNGKSICIASKVHRQGAFERNQKRRCSAFESFSLASARSSLSSLPNATYCRHLFEAQSHCVERERGQGQNRFGWGRGIPAVVSVPARRDFLFALTRFKTSYNHDRVF
jgi:hypothetical protein